MTITFTIEGNHKDRSGNPLPKAKLTRGQQWTQKAQDYAAWKQFVQIHYHKALRDKYGPDRAARMLAGPSVKPIVLPPGVNAHMRVVIRWNSGRHPDPENVFGSIADALFENDKDLSGEFYGAISPGKKGSVEITISIAEREVM